MFNPTKVVEEADNPLEIRDYKELLVDKIAVGRYFKAKVIGY